MERSNKLIPINYINGDATAPLGDGHKVIVHVCNDLGKWGKGFVLAISKRWKEPESFYKGSFQSSEKPELGDVQLVQVADSITVANIIGQHGVRSPRNKTAPAPIRYEAIRKGLSKVSEYAKAHNATIHMPRIGCGLAGGTWEKIEPIIIESVIEQDIKVFVYDF